MGSAVIRAITIAAITIATLAGCSFEPSELAPVSGALPFTGGHAVRPAAPATKLAPMMQDPEAQIEQSIDYVWADSQTEADAKCQTEADRYTEEGGSVVTVKRVRKTGKGTKYECTFEGER